MKAIILSKTPKSFSGFSTVWIMAPQIDIRAMISSVPTILLTDGDSEISMSLEMTQEARQALTPDKVRIAAQDALASAVLRGMETYRPAFFSQKAGSPYSISFVDYNELQEDIRMALAHRAQHLEKA